MITASFLLIILLDSFVDLYIHFPICLHDMHRDHVYSLLTSMGAQTLKESDGKISSY
jgi:hypothetical protein